MLLWLLNLGFAGGVGIGLVSGEITLVGQPDITTGCPADITVQYAAEITVPADGDVGV